MTFHKTSLTARRHPFFSNADGPFFVPGLSREKELRSAKEHNIAFEERLPMGRRLLIFDREFTGT